MKSEFGGSFVSERVRVLSLALLSIAVYCQTILYDFVYDDFHWVVNNPAIRSLGNIPQFFVTAHRGGRIGRPLTLVWYALDYAVAGAHPFLYHLENVLLHALVVVLVYLLLRRFARETAWLAAALFAVAPVHTEVVANVTSRAEMFATALALLALLQWKRPAVAATLLFLSLLAKETPVSVPALLLLLWWRGNERPSLRGAFITLIALGASVVAFLGAMYLALGHILWPKYSFMQLENPLALADWATRTRTALLILAKNLAICFVPYRLSADYSYPQIPMVSSWLDAGFLLWTSLLAAVLVSAWMLRRSRADITFGIAWFFVAILPVSNLLLIIGTIRAERLLYLPSVGASLVLANAMGLAAAWMTSRQEGQPASRSARVRVVSAIVVIAGFSAAAIARNGVWRNTDTIVMATAADSPNSARAQFDLGALFATKGDCEKATAHLQRALVLYPRFAPALVGLGVCRKIAGDLAGTRDLFTRASQSEPGDREIALMLASFCLEQQDWGCAATTLKRLLETNNSARSDASIWRMTGVAANRAGDWSTAEIAFRNALSLAAQPLDHLNLGGILAHMGRWRNAAAEYEIAERMGIRDEALYVDWAGVLSSAGQVADAREVALRGLKENPGSSDLKRLAKR